MLHVVTGPFHPSLEQTLLRDIASRKARDPFTALAIVVPSSSLAGWVKRLIAHQTPLLSLNCHVLTFHQFALRLCDDLVAVGALPGRLQFVDDFYFEQLVRHVVQRKLPGLEILSQLPASRGTWAALWSSLRDLKDAAVQPEMLLAALDDGAFEEEDSAWLRALFLLHAAILEASHSLAVGSPDDQLAPLSSALPQSPFLQQFAGVSYYGFYDFLQVQLSFLKAVARQTPVTLYVPLARTPPYEFARHIFDRSLLPLARSHDVCEDQRPSESPQKMLTVTNVVGAEEELSTLCRDILSLVEVHGYQFDEIGVVARSFDTYRSRLPSVFERHLVPLISTAGHPLASDPLAKALLRLASLPLNDFHRSALLDVVSSRWYRHKQGSGLFSDPRPDQWRMVTAQRGVTRGRADWQRLSDSTAHSTIEDGSPDSDDGAPRAPFASVDPRQTAYLASLVTRLMDDCDAVPPRGSAGQLTDAFLHLVEQHFLIPGWTGSEADEHVPGADRAARSGHLVRQALFRLAALDPLHPSLSWEEWVDLFRQAVEDTTVPFVEDPHRGVRVLDALAARGLTFRALFVIGLNEHVFPRVIREDPLLRDRHRKVLSSTLGFLIEEKLAGHEEERLLFELVCQAATHRLFLSYQRADEDGRILAPSPLLDRARRDPRFRTAPEITVPRQLTARVAAHPTVQDLLPAQDFALTLLLRDEDAGPVLELTGQDRHLCEHGLAAQKERGVDTADLGGFDGLLDSRAPIGSLFEQVGVSPTSLELYGRCPFRYYAEKVLQLESVRPTENASFDSLTAGILLHASLRLTYQRLTNLGWPEAAIDESRLDETVSTSVQETCAVHALSRCTGHELLWVLLQEELADLVRAAARADAEEYRLSGFQPHAFEVQAEGVFTLDGVKLPLRGRLDRVDICPNPPSQRIVDYKYKRGRDMDQSERNLLLAAVRGLKLQPPLYASMVVDTLPPASSVAFLYLAPKWEHPVARSLFDASHLSGQTGAAIGRAIAQLVQGIERREFFILPNDSCDHCDFSVVCRRHDELAWWRAHRSPQARALRRLHKQKVQDE